MKGGAYWYPRTGCNRGRHEPIKADWNSERKGKDRVESINNQSSHPMVNSTMQYQNVCWRYGNGPNADSPWHDSRQCQYPPSQNWEFEVFRSKHHERKENFETKESQIGTYRMTQKNL